jgi:excisionase family DNA binding protein
MSVENMQNLPNQSMETLLCCRDVANILKISRSKVYMLIQSGQIASIHIGANVRIKPSDLSEFVSNRRTLGTGNRL